MQNLMTPLRLVASLLMAAGALAQNPSPLVTRTADQLVAVLKSDAGQKEKADACRELAVIGGKDAVPALAALLADEKLSHMARYALETMPDPAVDAALRDALATTTGRQRVGVIGSLGVRRDANAVPALTALLTEPDPDVAQAAARALGSIGNSAAADALLNAINNTSDANLLAFCEGLARCAENLAATGQRDPALQIYGDAYLDARLPHQVRAAALRGAILTRAPAEGIKLLVEQLKSSDWILVAAAARAALEFKGGELSAALAAELGQLTGDHAILLTQVLAKRADAAALPALTSAARSGPKPVRLAAIKALGELSQPASVGPLVELMADPDRELAQTAKDSLAAIPGREADDTVIKLTSTPGPRQLTGIELIGRRRMASALPVLFKTIEGPDVALRVAALKQVGELGGLAEFKSLLAHTLKAPPGDELDATAQALAALAGRAGEPEAVVGQVTATLGNARPAQKPALLSVLASVGGPAALKAVRAAVNDPNAEVRAAAIRALSTWPSSDAAPDLLELAKSAANDTDKTLSLRGYLELASNPELSDAQRLAMCREVASLATRPEEKRLLLSALGNVASIDALPLIAPHLDTPATKEEASAAVVAVAEKLLRGRPAAATAQALVAPLEKAAQVTGNAALAKRAQALATRAKGRAGSQ